MAQHSYQVSGMTCGHCVRAVTEEVAKVAGVRDVRVELATGEVTVESDGAVDEVAVGAAIAQAGYEVVS